MTDAARPIVVFVHAFYSDIWAEMTAVLARDLRVPFDLVLTGTDSAVARIVPQSAALRDVRFVPTENRGRDILPFLTALAGETAFDIGLKLHTKKSPQREDGAAWRTEAMASLLGAPAIVDRLRADRRIGIVTPAQFCLHVERWIDQNGGTMAALMRAAGGELAATDMTDALFAAGSMFWFRRDAIAALARPQVRALFEAEEGQFDGTTAHAAERIFPVVAHQAGYLSLAVPALLASQPRMRREALLALAHANADVPNSFFPPRPPLAPARPARGRLGGVARAAYRAVVPLPLRRAVRAVLASAKISPNRA